MPLVATQDADVFIEAQSCCSTIYYRNSTGERWQADGRCIRLGNCIVGTTVGGEFIDSIETYNRLRKERGDSFFTFVADSPITPDFTGCCPFTFTVLGPTLPGLAA